MVSFFWNIISQIVSYVFSFGYLGVFLLMFLEGSFFPFPSEAVMIPAGFFASLGKMNFFLAILVGSLGTLSGAILNYYLGLKFGRPFLKKYGRYIFIREETIKKTEELFRTYGDVITFVGRLIPGVRQYISFPPGFARMSFRKFSVCTFLGAGLWVSILAFLGYFIGQNQEVLREYLNQITILLILISGIIVLFYVFYKKKRK